MTKVGFEVSEGLVCETMPVVPEARFAVLLVGFRVWRVEVCFRLWLLEFGYLIVYLRTYVRTRTCARFEVVMLVLTLAIKKYSKTTEPTFIPRLNMMAILVETPSTKAMTSGPISLRARSILRIWAFMAVPSNIST